MRTIILTALLLFAAGTARAAVPMNDMARSSPPATRADPPSQDEDQAQQWSPSLRASVMHQCEEAFPGEHICACLAHQIEVLSPDPEVVTSDAIQAGLRRCRKG